MLRDVLKMEIGPNSRNQWAILPCSTPLTHRNIVTIFTQRKEM
ncbi:hypothetical protein [Oceanicella actignis]|nr:hypothetical protein [Oceanicella actignis]